jgi:hypothetical protein
MAYMWIIASGLAKPVPINDVGGASKMLSTSVAAKLETNFWMQEELMAEPEMRHEEQAETKVSMPQLIPQC